MRRRHVLWLVASYILVGAVVWITARRAESPRTPAPALIRVDQPGKPFRTSTMLQVYRATGPSGVASWDGPDDERHQHWVIHLLDGAGERIVVYNAVPVD